MSQEVITAIQDATSNQATQDTSGSGNQTDRALANESTTSIVPEKVDSMLARAHALVLRTQINQLLAPGENPDAGMESALATVPEYAQPLYRQAIQDLRGDLEQNHELLESHKGQKVPFLLTEFITKSNKFPNLNLQQREALAQQVVSLADAYNITDNNIIEPSPGMIILNAGDGSNGPVLRGFFLELVGKGIIDRAAYMSHMLPSQDDSYPDFIITNIDSQANLTNMPEAHHEAGHIVWTNLEKSGFIPKVEHEIPGLELYFDSYRDEATQYLLSYGYSGVTTMTIADLSIPSAADKPEMSQAAAEQMQQVAELLQKAKQLGVDAEIFTYATMTARNFAELKLKIGLLVSPEFASQAPKSENSDTIDNPRVADYLKNKLLKLWPGLKNTFLSNQSPDNDTSEENITNAEVLQNSTDVLYNLLFQYVRLQMSGVPADKVTSTIDLMTDLSSLVAKLESVKPSQEPSIEKIMLQMFSDLDTASSLEEFQASNLYMVLLLQKARQLPIPSGISFLPQLQERIIQNGLALLQNANWASETAKSLFADIEESEQLFPQYGEVYIQAEAALKSLLTIKSALH